MKTRILILGMILAVATLTDCEKDALHPCPSCSDEITWDSYGEWALEGEGWDGDSRTNDAGRVNLIKNCGWKILGNFYGGTGNIYAAHSRDTTVLFVWSYGGFTVFIVYEGWTGQTKEGIRMGDSKEKFLEAYPEFKLSTYPNTDDSYLSYRKENRAITATFSKENKLIELYVRK